jgi:hypothetical protein
MSTPPPPLPSENEVEGDVLALLGAAVSGDEVGRRAILGNIEEDIAQGVPWQHYLAGVAAVLGSHIIVLLQQQGIDPAEWVAEKQAALRRRMADGSE